MQAGAVNIKLMADIMDVQRKFAAMQDLANSTASKIGGAFSGLGVKIGAALSVGALGAWVKSAINAADEMSKLSQKAGVAVKDVAGLQLAFRQSGLEAGTLQSSMAKLNKGIADGNKAFEAMGVGVRNADGSLKSARQVLGDVADRFATYKDGAEKARLAQELFGKAGADMIPLLNGGAAALDEFDAMAQKLGLTMDAQTTKQAEKFNDTLDLIGQGVQGVGRQVAAQLLPTLSGLAGQFFDNMTKGDRLRKVSEFLAAALKGLYIAGLGVVEVFTTVGKVLGGVSAAVVAALSGNFSEAAGILREMRNDIGSGWKDTLAQMQAAWNATGDASIESMAGTVAAMKNAAPSLKAHEDATKAATKATEDFIKLRDKLMGKEAGTDPEFIKNLQLIASEGRKAGMSLEQIVTLQEMYVESQPYMQEQIKATAKAQEEANKANADALDAADKLALSLQEQVKRQQEQNDAIGLTKTAIVALEAAKLREQATSKDRLATMADEIDWSGALGDSYRAQAKALRELADLKESGAAKEVVVEEARKATEEWKKFTDQVNQSLTDALMRAFESGGNFFKTMWNNIKNTLKTTVLKAIIQPVVGGITGAFGLSANAGEALGLGGGAGGSTMNLLSVASNAYKTITGGFTALGNSVAFAADSMGAWLVNNTTGVLNKMGGSLMQSAGSLGTAASYLGGAAAGLALGTVISNGYSAIGKSGNTATVAGTAIGAIFGGPIGAAIGGAIGGLVNRAFGRKAPVTTGTGISGTFSTGGANVSQYEEWFSKGGWFRSNKSGVNYSSVSSELDQFLDGALVQITAATRAYARILNLNADAINGVTQSVNISLMGLNAEQQQAKIAQALGGFGDKLAEQLLGTFTTVQDAIYGKKGRIVGWSSRQVWTPGEFVRAGETASEALSRLGNSLVTVNTVFDTLNVTLMKSSLVGGDAASKLLDLFGSAEQFNSATSAYYQAFYSQARRTAIATRQLTDVFRSMGMQLPVSREAFVQLVEAQDLYTAAGRATYTALIQLAPAFDEVARSAEEVAREVADKLIARLTGNRGMVPALRVASTALATTAQAAGDFAGPVSTIHRLLGDASSGVLTFGNRLTTTTAELTPAQLAVQQLQGEVLALRNAASGTVVDMRGLSEALANVDTRTFVATVTGVFELIGQRVKDTLGQIADERVAVREAAMGIVGPGVMTAAQIRQQISANMVSLPTSGIASARQALADADAEALRTEKARSDTINRLLSAQQELYSLAGRFGVAVNANAGAANWTNDAYAYNAQTNRLAGYGQITMNSSSNVTGFRAEANKAGGLTELLSSGNTLLAAVDKDFYAAINRQADAVEAAKQAQIDYVAALQKYSLDASKAVNQLGRLREETVRYYETQQQLASLMMGTAGSLRATVAAFRFDQLDPTAQMASLQERFNVAYSMAMSTSGETLAQYGQELNSLINPLLQKAQEAGLGGVQYSNLVNTILARAEATAGRLEQFAPTDYQAESLGLLGQIDSTLAALEKGALTADQLIVQAIDAGRDTTRDGLRAVVAALTGQAVPAFAMGGLHTGGARLVGEFGPELEVTGPARIYSASQTARMLGSGSDDSATVQELRALRAEVASQRQEMQVLQAQIVTNTGRTARQLDRWDTEGAPVRNADGQALAVEDATA